MKDEKQNLRAISRLRREDAAAHQPDAAERAAQTVQQALRGDLNDPFGLSALRHDVAVIGGYWPMHNELSPLNIMKCFRDRGLGLALPSLCADGDHPRMIMRFQIWTPEKALKDGPFGTRQPEVTARTVVPDLILVPLLGFDRTGYRLGYGGGYYDQYLHRHRSIKPLRAFGVAYEAQGLDQVPVEPHDARLDGVIMPGAIVVF